MSEPPEKIRILPEEVAAPIQISPPSKEPPLIEPEAPAAVSMPWYVWAAISLAPFLNAWIWWRLAPADRSRRTIFRGVAVLLGYLSVMATVGAALFILWPRRSWVEQAAKNAEYSVVRIESGDSLGAGFVIASYHDRHLLMTNRHVIESDSLDCQVRLRSGRVLPGHVAALPRDEDVDLAMVLVKSQQLAPLGRIADFHTVQVGADVVAIGHPLGLDYTLTTGIVSAKRGGIELQTSAPISPGNSGGPLLSRQGYVLGVNTRTVSPREGQSLGFAVRADYALQTDDWEFNTNVADLMERIRH